MAEKNTTIQSIADELGISVSTVSRVMNGVGEEYRISSKTIEAVQGTADKLNYRPNQIAKSLRLKKSSTIGLVIPDISNPWFAKIAQMIEEESRINDYNIFLCNSNGDVTIEKQCLNLLQNWMVDGIIVVPIGLESKHLMKTLRKGIPIVLADRFFENEDIPYVSTNDFQGSYEATEYLIQNGHLKIACIQGIIGTSSNNQRVGGYKKAFMDNGISINERFIMGSDFGFNNGYVHAKNLIEEIKKGNITAIFSVGNQITLGMLKIFKEEGVKVPEDVSIVSYDEQNYSELLYTPLSTISHGDRDLGKIAIKLLLNQIEDKTSENSENILLPTELIKRESVKNLTS